jgi:hypothetical protein
VIERRAPLSWPDVKRFARLLPHFDYVNTTMRLNVAEVLPFPLAVPRSNNRRQIVSAIAASVSIGGCNQDSPSAFVGGFS